MNALVINSEANMDTELVRRLSAQNFSVKTIGQDYEVLTPKSLSLYNLIVICKSAPLDQVFHFASKIRVNEMTRQTPLVLITCDYSEQHLIESLDRGFDDVFPTNINYDVLFRKFKLLLDRAVRNNNLADRFSKNGITLDFKSSTVFINDQMLPFTLTEFKLLKEILTQDSDIVNRRELQQKVFGYQDSKNRSMDVHLHNIRKKIEPYALTIEVIRSIGCRITNVR